MNIKEKQIVLYYLKNIINNEIAPEDTDDLLRHVWRMSSDLFGFDVRRLLHKMENGLEENQQMRLLSCLLNGRILLDEHIDDEVYINQITGALSQSYQSLMNVDITRPEFDKSFTYVCDAFSLPEKCRPLLQYFMYATKISFLRKIAGDYNDRFNDGLMHEENVEVMSGFCNIPVEDIKQYISLNGIFVESGILRSKYGDKEFSSMFSKLLGVYFDSTHAVHNFLAGNPLVSDLKRENFDYMAKDYDVLCDILQNAITKKQKGINILLYGKPGSGKTEIAKSVCNKIGVDLYTTPENKEDKDERLSGLCQLQTILQSSKNSVILFDEAEDVFSLNPFSNRTPSKLFINRKLEQNTIPVIWITNNIKYMDPAYIRRFTMSIEVQDPDEQAKRIAWKRIFDKYGVDIDEDKLSKMIRKYDISLSVIDTAVKNVKMLDNIEMLEYTIDNITKAMVGMAPCDKKEADVKFDTSLLNTDTDLKNLADKIKNKNIKSFSLCLYGAPGTGKSAYARYLGEMLNMPVIQKRASDIKSMWVGETEKNIAKAFAEAKQKKAILVFDEADSFLLDRNAARASWEVSCVNEMLTQMENAQYPFVCTTNLMAGIDKASLRRFSFKVKYDYLKCNQVVEACKLFFGFDANSSEIADLTKLAPGDFCVVKKQAELLGITDKAELLKMLKQEQAAKDISLDGNTRGKIGF